MAKKRDERVRQTAQDPPEPADRPSPQICRRVTPGSSVLLSQQMSTFVPLTLTSELRKNSPRSADKTRHLDAKEAKKRREHAGASANAWFDHLCESIERANSSPPPTKLTKLQRHPAFASLVVKFFSGAPGLGGGATLHTLCGLCVVSYLFAVLGALVAGITAASPPFLTYRPFGPYHRIARRSDGRSFGNGREESPGSTESTVPVNGRRGRPQGQCHRKHTAEPGDPVVGSHGRQG